MCKMNLLRSFLVVIIFYLSTVDGYRILGVFPLEARSHNIFFEALMKGLAKSGHQVDVISHYKIKNPPENLNLILDLSKFNDKPFVDLPIKKALDYQKKLMFHLFKTFGNDVCELMNIEEMQNIFKNSSMDHLYDLVITEFLTATCYIGLGHFLKIPVVGVVPAPESIWIANSIGNPLSIPFSPCVLMDSSEILTFSDRLENTILNIMYLFLFHYYTEEAQTEAMRKYLSPKMPSNREIKKKVALLLANNYHSLYGVRPTIPALVEVGGLHIAEDESKFTPDLKFWMDESKNGVVYFTLGTTMLIETLPTKTILAFYSSFVKISPVRILMRIKDERKLPSGLPKNVKTLPWIPQIPVLSHNNTRAFITHCGLLGLLESLYFGVPIIGIPLHSDQFRHVGNFVKKNMGIRINYEDLTEKTLDDALNRILNNSSYREAAKYESRIFRDRPMSPMDTAIFWVEYILRNGGKSIKSPTVDLEWWKIYLLDIIAFFVLSFILTIYITVIIFKIILNKTVFLFFAFFKNQRKNSTGHEKQKSS